MNSKNMSLNNDSASDDSSVNKYNMQHNIKRHLLGMYTQNDSNVEQLMPVDRDNCVLCYKPCSFECKQCGTSYCSVICQKNDWPWHRYICISMPPLIRKKTSLPEISTNPNNHESKEMNEIPISNSDNNKQRIPPAVPKPLNGSCVILCSIRRPNRCYIRSVNPSVVEGHACVIDNVQRYGMQAPKLSTAPTLNSYAIMRNKNGYYRVKIIRLLYQYSYLVWLVDTGHVKICYRRSLCEISEEILALPCYLTFIRLHGLDHLEDKLENSLCQYENRKFKIIWMKSPTEAKLLYWETNEPLVDDIINYVKNINKKELENTNLSEEEHSVENNAIKQDSFTTNSSDVNNVGNIPLEKNNIGMCTEEKGEVAESNVSPMEESLLESEQQQSVHFHKQEHCIEPPFDIIYFPKNAKNFTAIVIDITSVAVGGIGCMLNKHVPNLLKMQKYLKEEFKDNGIPYKPILNEYCIAQYEKDWYRGKIIDILSSDKYNVLYIDFTNELVLSSKEIRPYIMELTHNCATNFCLIKDLPKEMNEKQIEFLKRELKVNTSFHIDSIVDIYDDFIVIECTQLIEKMQKQRLL